MNLYPAIDILGGSAVRLVKGDFDARKVYDEDPLAAARGWTEAGADRLHVVDLDGAKTGAPVNLEHLRRIVRELGVPVQYGGGLRSAQAVSDALQAGAARVILGTAAFTQAGLLERALGEHGPERVLVSVDVRGGHVATAGWTETTEITTETVLESLAERGVRELVFTNVDRDGMLEGPDFEEVRRVAEAVRGSVIYSGGIGRLADLKGLASLGEANRKERRAGGASGGGGSPGEGRAGGASGGEGSGGDEGGGGRSPGERSAGEASLEKAGLAGVIVGKALYERRFTVGEARAVLGG